MEFERNALPRWYFDAETYRRWYDDSITHRNKFWAWHGKRIDWFRPFKRIRDVSFAPDDVRIRWFYDGTTNASYNCLDRHLAEHGGRTAILWEGDCADERRAITYRELHELVCRFANALRALGCKRGDRVTIYLPMIPEIAVAMLACARIGAVHSVVFGGFSPESLASRIQDCRSRILITADEGRRGGRIVPLKANADTALRLCPSVEHCVVVRHTGGAVGWSAKRDRWYHELLAPQSPSCAAEEMSAEDPLFILHTSGSTGKPKGLVHTTGGYLVAVSMSHQYALDYHDGDIYWCTADIGWITGHSYVIYGPLANAATIVLFEGIPTYPSASRYWEICDRYGVSILYTAPTVIRTLMREGEAPLIKSRRGSLRLLGTAGEPINPEAWRWYHDRVGDGRCPVIDTWWQTETGGIQLTPLPGVHIPKPGSAARPFFGVVPTIVDDDGNVVRGSGEGNLCLAEVGPGMARSIFGDHRRFVETYFTRFPGFYFTGDGARRDDDGYYWITGRVDDVINVAGHRLGTAEIESVLVAHRSVAEAAVVGYPHEIKGQGIYAYVSLRRGFTPSSGLRSELAGWVREKLGPIATPDRIQWATNLPKTRSGKILRRLLRQIAKGDETGFGDVSTLAEPSVVEELVVGRGTLYGEGGGTLGNTTAGAGESPAP
jgi:acetyl-CoA synthetase